MINTIKQRFKYDEIKGLESVRLDTFRDFRGEIWTIYSENHYDYTFVQDKISVSKFGVLRGFHGDSNTVKFISCISGDMQLAVADLRKDSETYGNSKMFFLTDREPSVVIVPAGCINAHLVLSNKCIFYYKWSEKYSGPQNQVTIAWNDPDLNMDWANKSPILSERDESGQPFKGSYL